MSTINDMNAAELQLQRNADISTFQLTFLQLFGVEITAFINTNDHVLMLRYKSFISIALEWTHT